MEKDVYIIGVAGGSGSGKSYFSKSLVESVGENFCALIYQDNFYFDQSSRFDYDGGSVNFDHPNAIDFNLLAEKLSVLKNKLPVEIPIYDFSTHARKTETITQQPKQVIIVDGILILYADVMRPFFDEMIFFDTPEELRFKRRLERDVKERGRTPDGVFNQFFKQVKPMHDEFVGPSRDFADYIIKDQGDYHKALETFSIKLKYLLGQN